MKVRYRPPPERIFRSHFQINCVCEFAGCNGLALFFSSPLSISLLLPINTVAFKEAWVAESLPLPRTSAVRVGIESPLSERGDSGRTDTPFQNNNNRTQQQKGVLLLSLYLICFSSLDFCSLTCLRPVPTHHHLTKKPSAD